MLGEWGRWCDVVVLMENDGTSLERVKISVRKRVRHERRIVATKRGGLLVEPVDTTDAKPAKKVSEDAVMAAVAAQPGITYMELAKVLGVGKSTASGYIADLGDRATPLPNGPRRQIRVYPTAQPPSIARTDSRGTRITKDSKHSTRRIDLAVAAVMAHARAAELAHVPAVQVF